MTWMRTAKNLFWWAAIVFAVIAMTYVGPAESQQNWIKCKHTVTGAVQMFPGMQCPPQWFPV